MSFRNFVRGGGGDCAAPSAVSGLAAQVSNRAPGNLYESSGYANTNTHQQQHNEEYVGLGTHDPHAAMFEEHEGPFTWHSEFMSVPRPPMHGGATGFVEEFERMQQERRWAEEFHLHQQQQIAFHHHQQQQVKGISASEEQWVNEFGQMRVGDDLMQKEREVNVQAGGSGGIDQEAIQKLLNSDNPKFRNSKFVKFLSQLNSGELELDVENNTIRTNVATQSNLDEKWAEEFDTSQSIGRNTEERWANEFHSTTADQWAQEFEEQSSQWANEFDQGVNQSQDWANEFDSIDWKEYVDNLHEAKFGETDFSAFNTKREYQFAENNPYMQSSDPYSLGLQLMRDGNLSEAVLAFEAVVQKMPEHVEAWRYLGQCHQENESENQAIAALSSAVDLDAYNLDALLMLGVSYTNDLEQSSALKHLRSWIENHPDYQSISFENHSHSDFVNVDQVLKIFNQAAQINPHDVEIQTALGVLYNISNDYDAAIECFRRCVQIRSDDASLWNKLGATQANGSRSAEAVDSYRRALELKPNYVRALANLGISFANQGLHEQAAQAYLATLTRNPSADHVWNYLRISFSSMNRPELEITYIKANGIEWNRIAAELGPSRGHINSVFGGGYTNLGNFLSVLFELISSETLSFLQNPSFEIVKISAEESQKIEITHDTRIINIGHLPGHTHGKTELLKKEGFRNVESFLSTETGAENIKQMLKGKNDTLLLVGGAMMKGFPSEMKEILDFLKTDAPEVFVYITSQADFPPGIQFPPSQEIVNQSAVTICNKLLKCVCCYNSKMHSEYSRGGFSGRGRGGRRVDPNVRPDGRNRRDPVVRKTVDYVASVIKYLMNRMYRSDDSQRKYLQASMDSVRDIEPSFVYKDQPSNAFTSKYVESRENKPEPRPVNALCWTPEGRRLITGYHSGEFTLWDGIQFNFVTIMQAHSDPIRAMLWSHDGEWLVSGDDGGVVKYWQPSMNNVKAFSAHSDPLRDITFCPTDRKFATCSDDRTIKIWDFATCAEEATLLGHGWDVKTIDWHPRKALLASGGKDNLIKLWDPKSARDLFTLNGHKNTVSKILWNANGNTLVSASRDQLIKLWDVRMLKEIHTYKGHTNEVTSICWHPFIEDTFASGDFDGNVLFWVTGWPTAQGEILNAHHNPSGSAIWDMAYHPLGHLLATGSSDRTVKFWTRNRPGDEMRDKYNVLQLPPEVRNEAVISLIESARMNQSRFSSLPERIEKYEVTFEEDDQSQAVPQQIPGLGAAQRLIEQDRARKDSSSSKRSHGGDSSKRKHTSSK